MKMPAALRVTLGLPVANRLLIAVLLAGCAHQPPAAEPTPADATNAAGGISLRDGWRATVLVQRADSIILTLPSGDRQLQRFDRRAGFTLAMDGDGKVTLRLDSLTFRPPNASDSGVPLGATWAGRPGDVRVNALRKTSGGDLAAELTTVVRTLLPRLPAGANPARMTWADTASGTVRIDVFSANERRTASWSSGSLSDRAGGQVLAVRMREDFEQLGDGSQGGHRLTMTSQGHRSGTYYVTKDGRVNSAELDDSVAMLISIPATKQVVPTMRYARTSVRFIPISHNESD